MIASRGSGGPRTIRRILVALDTSVDSEAALKASARLASRLQAELVGLYVEDINLLRLAEHPTYSEVEYFSARPRRPSGPELERQLRMQMEQLRRRLTRIAAQLGVRSSFVTARGRVAAQLLESLEGADLVGIGVRGRSKARGPGSTLQALLGESRGPLLILQRGMRLGSNVHLLYDGGDAARRALEFALALIRDERMSLTVLLAGSDTERQRLEQQVRELLADRALEPEFGHLPDRAVNAGPLADTLRQRKAGLLIAARESLDYDRRELGRLLARLHCPLLMVAG